MTIKAVPAAKKTEVSFDSRDAGQMSAYLSAVDDQLRHEDDRPSIGIILCKTKDNVFAEYTPSTSIVTTSKPIKSLKFRIKGRGLILIQYYPLPLIRNLRTFHSVFLGTIEVEGVYVLRNFNRPIGIAEFELKLGEKLPEDLKASLPTIEEIEAELSVKPEEQKKPKKKKNDT